MKTALVTGAAGNLGKATVLYFLEKEYHVAGFVRNNNDVSIDNYNYKTVTTDLLNAAAVEQQVNKLIETNGTIDAAVLTAGGFAMGTVEQSGAEDLRKMYQLNFETAYNVARPVFLQMKKQGSGSLFFIGSQQGLEIKKGTGVVGYGLSKSLLFNLADIMNKEAAGTSVKVYVVVPGIIDTPENRKAMPEANTATWTSPEAIAAIIYNYASGKMNEDSRVIKI